jgi:serine protease inhibitor
MEFPARQASGVQTRKERNSMKTSMKVRIKITMKQTLFLVWSWMALCMPAALEAQVQSLVAGNTAFALNLYAQLAANNSSNLFFSPYSISTCLGMTYAGARGNTEAQMAQVLGFSTNQPQFASDFGQLQTQLAADQQTNAVELDIANALWTQVGFPFLPTFLETATNQFQANVNQADFTHDAAAATQTINNWVAQETRNKIQNLIPPGAINAYTRLVLVNAIYFLGSWAFSFQETNTSTQTFYLSSTNQVQAPLMYQPEPGGIGRGGFVPDDGAIRFNYMQTNDFQALELPYASNQLSMVILLPTRVDGLGQLERELSPELLSNVLAQMWPQYVEIYLPRFTNESSFNLTTNLEGMGMSDAFTPGAADFSGMDGSEDLSISFVFHKAWCQVDEAGTEAAAATGGGAHANIVITYPIYVFRADHPFIYLIRDTQTGTLLFMGRLVNPSQSAPAPVPKSRLAVTSSANQMVISWPYASTPTPWVLQESPDLIHWTPVATGPGSAFAGASDDWGTNYSIMITPASTGNLFFRLSRQ